MKETKYYDGNRIVNTLDLDKQKPAIVMIAGNRTAGKTFWVKKFLVKKFLKQGSKFIILQRFGYNLTGTADTFIKDLKQIVPEYADFDMTEKVVVKSSINSLYLNGEHCGFCISLNNADSIKKNSTLFVDVDYIFLDEFQSETGKYCPNEIDKFISIYTSVARGKGEQSRYVMALLCSNNVSLLNPYYYSLGVASRIQKDTKILRGHGWVLELVFNENARQAMVQSGIGRAFANSDYIKYSSENVYLNDSDTFIEKPTGDCRLLCVIDWENETYGIWQFNNFMYVSRKYDPNFRTRIALDVKSHNKNTVLLKQHNLLYCLFKEYFNCGLFRFQNLRCKEMLFFLIGY